MKKFISLILAVVLVLVVTVPVVAAERACSHTPSGSYIGSPWIEYEPYGSGKCRPVTYAQFRCGNCNAYYTDAIAYGTATTHSYEVYSASCNGTTQTWLNRCSRCNSTKTTTQSCPGGPHTGMCRWLPV